MANPFHYRQAERADLAHMFRIWATEKAEGGASEERMTAYFEGKHNPQQALPPRVIYVAQEDRTLIGYIAGHLTRRFGCDGELEWLYVIPERRRCSVATGLMSCLAGWFKQHSAAQVCVNVAGSNTVALGFYTKHGAEPMKPGWMMWSDFAKSIEKAQPLNPERGEATQKRAGQENP